MANRIWVELPQPSYFTGDVVSGNVVVETDKPVEARGLYLDILGREATKITASGEAERHVPFPGGPHRMADDPPRAGSPRPESRGSRSSSRSP